MKQGMNFVPDLVLSSSKHICDTEITRITLPLHTIHFKWESSLYGGCQIVEIAKLVLGPQ